MPARSAQSRARRRGILQAPIIMLAAVNVVFACLWGVSTEDVWYRARQKDLTDRK